MIKNIKNFNVDDKITIKTNINKIDFLLKDCNISFDNNILKNKNFDELNLIPGVWSLWGKDIRDNKKYCLTGGQTENLGKELNWTLRVIGNLNLQKREIENPGCTGNWDKIQKYYKDYEYVLILKDEEDFITREAIEAIYCQQNNTLYWNPSITQYSSLQKFLNNDRKNSNNSSSNK